jgi:glucose-6-phosphate 1-dehydrogenase
MAESRHMVVLDFREPAMKMFPTEVQHQGANQLVFELTEPGSITADFQAKVPGATMELGPARMVFRYEQSFQTDRQLEAYERLIHDAMLGDAMLFTNAEGIERLWAISADVLTHPGPLHPYPRGSWGPAAAQDLIAPYEWRLPEREFDVTKAESEEEAA